MKVKLLLISALLLVASNGWAGIFDNWFGSSSDFKENETLIINECQQFISRRVGRNFSDTNIFRQFKKPIEFSRTKNNTVEFFVENRNPDRNVWGVNCELIGFSEYSRAYHLILQDSAWGSDWLSFWCRNNSCDCDEIEC